MDQAHARLGPESLGVRSAVSNAVAHSLQNSWINRPGRISIEHACDATHGLDLLPRSQLTRAILSRMEHHRRRTDLQSVLFGRTDCKSVLRSVRIPFVN